jgi:predicted metal-binding membrane protein
MTSYPLRRERNLILALLLLLAAFAWVLLIRQSAMADESMTGSTMGMGPVLFLAIGVALMFPTAAAMILMFARVHASKRERGQAFVPAWAFVSACLLVWTLFGVLGDLLAVGAEALAEGDRWLMDNGGRVGGAALVLAGLYRLSPLKRTCLSKCRSPLDFLLNSWPTATSRLSA